jgi:flagellin-like hook-associated protein FlgL
MKRANNLLTKSLQRLSSGKRIVSPSDDAGGLAVGMKLQSTLKRAAASRMNTQNGVSFLQMQDGVMKVAGEILDRMSELKSFYNDISKNATDRETYNHEFHELQKELNALKAQKLNGVSLFASVEANGLGINTSDDGLGENIKLTRTGFFENLKSKFGADSVLNSGSQGEFRQLVGDFTRDGGILDANPGNTSQSYAKGQVIYKNGTTEKDSGYFMALENVMTGTAISDNGGANSSFIRLADKSGIGFAESFPNAPAYDHNKLQYNSNGQKVAYLAGDVVKVPAHWASPGSSVFLKANSDVPQGVTLEELFKSGQISKTGYFDFTGKDTSNGALTGDKPTTDFLRTNSNLAMPSIYNTGGSAAAQNQSLRDLMVNNASKNYTPNYILSGTSIYAPTTDWGINLWNSGVSFDEGQIVIKDGTTTASIYSFNSLVKGTYVGGSYSAGSFAFHDGAWLRAEVTNNTSNPVSIGAVAGNPESMNVFSATQAYSAGDQIKHNAANSRLLHARAGMKGEFQSASTYSAGDTVFSSNKHITLTRAHHGNWNASVTPAANGDTVHYNGDLYKFAGGDASIAPDPTGAVTANWTKLAGGTDLAAARAADNTIGTDNTGAVATDAARATPTTYFQASAWQKFSAAGANIGDPLANGGATDVTAQYQDVTNQNIWTRTHFSDLQDITVNTSYTRGDNILYQGKHYVYTSHLDSNNPKYLSPSSDGYTEFEDLLNAGAVTELSMYVDNIGGGGGSGLPDGVYYRPNQSLEYSDRLPNSGTVRTNSIERRTDSASPPGDEIFNSRDDQFYGGLNAGNDGIYGTTDDFYASTGHSGTAMAGAHIDSDADNNKDLLDTANGLENFSVADFVDYIQSLANMRAVNGGTMSRLNYATNLLEENEINLGAATSRIMDADMAQESTLMARQNVLVQASASMVTQANQMTDIVLQLLR